MGKISVGVAGAIGVVVGILLAPRKGSETRKQIVQRTEPLQEAARKAASRAGDAVKPVTKMVGERVPLIGKDGVKPEEPVVEASGKNSSISGGREDGAVAGRRAKPEKVSSRS